VTGWHNGSRRTSRSRAGEETATIDRRGAVALGMGAAVSLAAARRAAATADFPPGIPEWERQPGAPVLSAPYGRPSPYESGVVRRPRRHARVKSPLSSFSLTPLQDLNGIVTPNGLHFERHHAGIPAIDPGAHRLLVHGLVRRPMLFTMEDLVRFPSVSRFHFIECAGNTQGWTAGESDLTVQDTHGLISCCEWTGVPLATVLEEAGAKPEAAWILAEGADAASMTRSVPIAKALDDALLAYAQNGERLRPEQGYPLRLLLPGFEGNTNVKWLRRLKLSTAPFETREETSKYTQLLPDGKAVQFEFVMEVKSVITRPSGGQRLARPGFWEISGLAWSGRGEIARVEVSVDGGRTWRETALQEPVLAKCLTRFRLPWHWDGGPALLQSRAFDATGQAQPTHDELLAARGANAYYHYNAIQAWRVAAGGAVSHAA
jgi:sulfane dehydrogenase subunit SoxC